MKLVKVQNTLHLISKLTTEELELLTKAGKNIVTFEEDGKKAPFAMALHNKANAYGAGFPKTTDDGYAMAAIGLDTEDENPVETFIKEHAEFILNVKAAEEILLGRVAELKATTEALINTVETITINGGEA